jgi:hypothetical protein
MEKSGFFNSSDGDRVYDVCSSSKNVSKRASKM